jgi:four helix bundle protein
MFLNLNHKKLDVYNVASELLTECYKIASALPANERFSLVQQIIRAAVSVKLNISEGASRKSTAERKRFYEIARGSVIELDSAMEVVILLKYVDPNEMKEIDVLLNRCFAMLSRMTGPAK